MINDLAADIEQAKTEAVKLHIEYVESGHSVGISAEAVQRLEKFLADTRKLNFKYVVFGGKYTQLHGYQKEFTALKIAFIIDVSKILTEV